MRIHDHGIRAVFESKESIGVPHSDRASWVRCELPHLVLPGGREADRPSSATKDTAVRFLGIGTSEEGAYDGITVNRLPSGLI